ncbi:Uncharacterised protein [uncultured archaeon]|nr:Uncharacterised protein [uncultured archaeon]
MTNTKQIYKPSLLNKTVIRMPETTESQDDLTFTSEQAKQIKELFWKDKEFKNNYFRIRNAWLLQKISQRNAVQLMKEELEKH